MRKVMQTLGTTYYNLLKEEAENRKITIQELVRIIAHEWLIMRGIIKPRFSHADFITELERRRIEFHD